MPEFFGPRLLIEKPRWVYGAAAKKTPPLLTFALALRPLDDDTLAAERAPVERRLQSRSPWSISWQRSRR